MGSRSLFWTGEVLTRCVGPCDNDYAKKLQIQGQLNVRLLKKTVLSGSMNLFIVRAPLKSCLKTNCELDRIILHDKLIGALPRRNVLNFHST
jgi:hypothetical protein